jgi:hypothetical protein
MRRDGGRQSLSGHLWTNPNEIRLFRAEMQFRGIIPPAFVDKEKQPDIIFGDRYSEIGQSASNKLKRSVSKQQTSLFREFSCQCFNRALSAKYASSWNIPERFATSY